MFICLVYVYSLQKVYTYTNAKVDQVDWTHYSTLLLYSDTLKELTGLN